MLSTGNDEYLDVQSPYVIRDEGSNMTKYFDSGEEKYKPLPKAPYYVLSNDVFMSNWEYAKNTLNVCVVPCKDYETAKRVANYAKSRSDQKYVRIVIHPPRKRDGVIYSLVMGWIKLNIN
jgi:hypothetical protein